MDGLKPLTDNMHAIKKAIDAGADTIVLKSITSIASDEKPVGKRTIGLNKFFDFTYQQEVPMPGSIYSISTDLDCEMITVNKSNELYDAIKEYSPQTKVVANLAPITKEDFNLAKNIRSDAIEINTRWYDLNLQRPYFIVPENQEFDPRKESSQLWNNIKNKEETIEHILSESEAYKKAKEEKKAAFKEGLAQLYGTKPLLLKLARQGQELNAQDYEDMAYDGITFSDSVKSSITTQLCGAQVELFGRGSFSGAHLTDETLAKVQFYKEQHPDKYFSASGGIMNAKDAQEAIKRGAGSVQLCATIYLNGFDKVTEIANVTKEL